jgi:tRNA(Ile)-lysidine synthase
MPTRLNPDLNDPAVLAQLFAPAASELAIALAVSGGPDSLALMLLAQRWATSLDHPPKIIVYSLDHGLRPEARQEVDMVLEAAARLGLAARGLVWTGNKPETGIQEAARSARYRLIGEAMRTDGATLLLTGHHRADQAETVLMRLAHGSGIEGLKGMASLSTVEGTRVFRPLLDIDPEALAELVEAAALLPARDPSNDDPAYERVRWRKLMPALAAEGLDGPTLSRFAARMAEADLALAQMTDIAFGQLAKLDGFGAARLPLTAFLQLTPAVGRRLLARVLNITGGRQKPRALGQMDRLYDQLVAGDLSRGVTCLGAVVRAKGEDLVVSREPGRALPAEAHLPPHHGVIWDERFLITNLSDETGIVAGAADFLPRHRLETVLGFKVTSPAEAIRTAPLVRDADGELLALGGWSFDERVKVELLID